MSAEETPLEMETEIPYTLVKMEILETETEEASIRYALLGEGDGLEAFELYAPDDGTEN